MLSRGRVQASSPHELQTGLTASPRGVIQPGFTHLGSGPTECRTNAVFGYPRGPTYLLISLAVEVVHGDQIFFLGVKLYQKPFDFVTIQHGLFGGRLRTGPAFVDLARGRVGKGGHRLVLEHLSDDDSPGNHGQVGCQTGLATKVSKNGKIILDQVQKDLGTEVIAIIRREPHASGVGRVIDDVNHQTQEPIDKILPCPGLLVQAPFEEVSVNLGEGHGMYPQMSTDGRGVVFVAEKSPTAIDSDARK